MSYWNYNMSSFWNYHNVTYTRTDDLFYKIIASGYSGKCLLPALNVQLFVAFGEMLKACLKA